MRNISHDLTPDEFDIMKELILGYLYTSAMYIVNCELEDKEEIETLTDLVMRELREKWI